MSTLKLLRISKATLLLTTSFQDVMTFITSSAAKNSRLSSADVMMAFIHINMFAIFSAPQNIEAKVIFNDGVTDYILEHLKWEAAGSVPTPTFDALSSPKTGSVTVTDERFNFLQNGYRLNRSAFHVSNGSSTKPFDPSDQFTLSSPQDLRVQPSSPLVIGPLESLRIQMKQSAAIGSATVRYGFLANAVEEAV